MRLQGIGQLLSSVLPRKGGRPQIPPPIEDVDVLEQLAQLGIVASPEEQVPRGPSAVPPGSILGQAFPQTAGAPVPQVPTVLSTAPTGSGQIYDQLQDLLAAIKEPAPLPTAPKVNPLEQILELYAVSQGGPTNAGGAYDLAQQRAQFGDAAAMRSWESRVNAAKTGLQYGVPMFNAVLDRETALDNLEYKLKAAELAGAAKQAVAAIKAQKETRFKIGQLIADGKATVPAIAQVLMGTGADPDMANATAQEIIKDVQTNGLSWMQQYRADIEDAKATKAQSELAFKNTKEDNRILEDPGATLTQKIAAVGRLQAAGQLPQGDPVAMAKEISTEAGKMIAQTKLAEARTETEKIAKQYKETLFKNLPTELADKHARSLAQIDHWRNIDAMQRAGMEFKMAESARDNLITRYGKSLDSLGRDITTLTNDIISLRDKRKEWEKLSISIPTNAQGKAADQKNQADLDRAKREIEIYDKNVQDKLAQRATLQKAAEELRRKIEEDDVEGEVAAGRERVEAPPPQQTSAGSASSGKTVKGKRTGATLSLAGG